jgi:hypothetical protein
MGTSNSIEQLGREPAAHSVLDKIFRHVRRLMSTIALLLIYAAFVGGCRDGGSLGGGFTEVGLDAGVDWGFVPANQARAIDLYDHGSGVAATDIDDDGHADLFLLSQCGPSGLYYGRGDGTFINASNKVAQLDEGVRVSQALGDYDNDGDIDIYVTYTRHPSKLLRQEEDGSFTDVAAEAGVDRQGHFSAANFADADGDGDLDLVVGGTCRFTTDSLITDDPTCGPHYEAGPFGGFDNTETEDVLLFINEGEAEGFTFREAAKERGLPGGGIIAEGGGCYGDAFFADFDRDGDPDLVLPEMWGKSQFLENDGKAYFKNVTDEYLPRASAGAMSISVADYDGDAEFDLFTSDMHSDMWVTEFTEFRNVDPDVRYLGWNGPHLGEGDPPEGVIYGNTLWLTEGQSRPSAERAIEWNAETFQPWGHLPADFDNDGDLDIFLPAGMSNPFDYWPDDYLQNDGDGFTHLAAELGLNLPGGINEDLRVAGRPKIRSSRTVATADFDEDGDLDIFLLRFGERAAYFRNDLQQDNHWIDIDVRSSKAEPLAAVVELEAGGRQWVSSVGGMRSYLSESTRLVHFGLGSVDSVDRVTVTWRNGTKTTLRNPTVDQRVVIRQGAVED